MPVRILVAFALFAALAGRTPAAPPVSAAPDFNRDIRPILAAHCLKCHGPDEKQRQAGLRLDQRGDALRRLASGRRAIVPGRTADSTLVARVHATDATMMPPRSANKPLSVQQRRTLERWVAAGADYAPHWAFVAPKAQTPPKLPAALAARARGPIDQFVFGRLAKSGL
ncbi:MAG: c-type cytochrome domain-containing protein, partial [Armatimonadota bacterium]